QGGHRTTAGRNRPAERPAPSRTPAAFRPWPCGSPRRRTGAGFRDRLGVVARAEAGEGEGLFVQDLVGLAVDLLLLGRGDAAGVLGLRRAGLGVAGVGLVGHRVLALV